MLLAINIGNSTVAWGLFEQEELRHHGHVSTDPARSYEAYADIFRTWLKDRGLAASSVDRAILSSVVPTLTPTMQRLADAHSKAPSRLVSADFSSGLTLRYATPQTLGCDRLVVAAAAFHRHRQAVIVVDLGTATTFNVVTRHGEFLGGAIAPGLALSAEALATGTAQLPRVEMTAPTTVISRETAANIQSGLMYGHACMVDGMVARMRAELGGQALAIATGGWSTLLKPLCHTLDETAPFLALEGLALLDRLNVPR